MSILIKKYKKLVKELLFAYSELEYLNEVLLEAHRDFEEYYQSFCREKSVPIGELNNKNSDKLKKIYPPKEQKTDEEGIVQYEKSVIESPAHKVFQRMYRQIAKKIHPDKFSSREITPEIQEKIESFKQVTSAYDKKNWAEFLDICEKHDILPTRYEKINSVIKKEIDSTNQEIRDKKLSFSWRLYSCDGDESCKEKIIKDFLYQLFKYNIS